MRVDRERYRKALGECSHRQVFDQCYIEGDDMLLCIYDEGFLIGFEQGFEACEQSGHPTAGASTTIIFTPGIPQPNQTKEPT